MADASFTVQTPKPRPSARASGLFDGICRHASPSFGAEPATQIRLQPLGVNEAAPIEANEHRMFEIFRAPQFGQCGLGHRFGGGGQMSISKTRFDLDEKLKIRLDRPDRSDDL